MKIQTMLELERVNVKPLTLIETIQAYEREGWQFISVYNIEEKTLILFDKHVKGIGE